MKRVLVLIMVFCFFGCKKEVITPRELSNNPLLTNLDVEVDRIFQANKAGLNSVGVSIGILKRGQFSYYGYGETQKGSGIIPNMQTYFEIGSVTKVFTALAIVRMLEIDGKSIDTPIRSYLPENLPPLNRNGVEITFKHLLTHTSGLPYMPNNLSITFFTNIAKGWRDYDNEKLFSCLKGVRLAFEPFTNFLYSNTAFGVLTVILERRFNKDYGEVIRTLVLEPLNLHQTTAYFSETNQNNWSKGYAANGKETSYWETLNALDGAGVIKSNAEQMLLFAQQNITIPNNILSNSIALCQNIFSNIVNETSYEKTVNCLGWFSYQNKGLDNETFLYHNGATGGFNTEFFINKNKQSALIILYNTNNTSKSRQNFTRELLTLISQ